MSAPIVSWYNSGNTATVTGWDIGIVDAGGNASASTEFIIWNNRGGSTAVSNMTNCTITTVATDMNSPIITGKWIQLRIGTTTPAVFEAIGGTGTSDVRSIKAVNSSVAAGTIEGGTNNGTTSADSNFARVELRALVPSTAVPGVVNFTTRVAYQYI